MELSYWQKQDHTPLLKDLDWVIPEQKTGDILVIGGNSQNFLSAVRSSEFLSSLPFKSVQTLLPDSLKNKIPPLLNIDFAPATPSGSFDKSALLESAVQSSDFNLFIGDFSKNSTTAIALSSAIQNSEKPCLITRDSVDLLTPDIASILSSNLFILASMSQLQKIFRTLYYPKMILLSMPLLPVLETLHKFSLSYPSTILTFHSNQIILAKDGKIVTTSIENTNFTPLSLWGGTLACKIAALNLWHSTDPLSTTASAILWRP